MNEKAEFREFWPYYLQEHARPGTRALHYAGTSLVIILAGALSFTGRWWIMPAIPLVGYGFAWIGHGLVERNRPATLRYPLWSLRADFWMWFRFITGRMGRELAHAGIRPDGSIDPDKRLQL
ncbi:MAG TPA: DUF962 domain-containing protein [Sphingobium sp.]